MGKIIAVAEESSGVGAAVFAANLGAVLAARSKAGAALVDLSGRGETGAALNCEPEKRLADLIPLLPQLDYKLIRGFLSVHSSGVSILESSQTGEGSPVRPEHIRKVLSILSGAFPYTIVTLPEADGRHILPVLDKSDLLLLLAAPNVLSLNRARMFLEILDTWHCPRQLIKPVCLTSGGKRSLFADKVNECLGLEPAAEIPFDAEMLAESINRGTPAVLTAPQSPFSAGIRALAQRIAEGSLFAPVRRQPQDEPGDCGKTPEEPGPQAGQERLLRLKEGIHRDLIAEMSAQRIDIAAEGGPERAASEARRIIQSLLARSDEQLNREERSRLTGELLDSVLGFGPIEEYLAEPAVTEIMINGPDRIYIERQGRISRAPSRFDSASQLMTVIDRIVAPVGRRVDESSPLVDARLPDGSRVNIVIPPLSLTGPVVTIRKFSQHKLAADDLVRMGALNRPMAEFLRVCVLLRKNIVVSGGTGSGKTTLLNALAAFIPPEERIVTIEDSAELRLPQEHVVRLEARPPSIEGTGEIGIRRLVINALRMRPDRIVVGECRGGEALDMLQAMNTGHDGSLTTVHANTPRDAVARLTTMVIMAGTELPERAIREQIGSAIQIIVQLARLSDGSRKITEIAELLREDDGGLRTAPIFRFAQTGVEDGKVSGTFTAAGHVPGFINDIGRHGLSFDTTVFQAGEAR